MAFFLSFALISLFLKKIIHKYAFFLKKKKVLTLTRFPVNFSKRMHTREWFLKKKIDKRKKKDRKNRFTDHRGPEIPTISVKILKSPFPGFSDSRRPQNDVYVFFFFIVYSSTFLLCKSSLDRSDVLARDGHRR